MNDTVGVVITTRNRILFLKKALKSVFCQSLKPDQIIIIDDASSDGTQKYLHSQKESFENLDFISLKKRENGNYCRNLGISKCHCKYIALLDDDDTWCKNKLEKQITALIENEKYGYDFCYTGSNRIIDNKYIVQVPAEKSGNLSKEIFSGIIAITSSMVFKKELWSDVGKFNEDLNHWQEFEFTIKAFQTTKVLAIEECLTNINVDTESKKRLSNQYEKWLISQKRVERIVKMMTNDKKNLHDFENFSLEDGANRLMLNGEKSRYMKKMVLLFFKTFNLKYLIRGLLLISAEQIQKFKGKKITCSDRIY
jgi:glycosyltransferase involved in cell wall biosynthesis